MEKVYSSITSANRQERRVHILEIIGNASFGGMERYVINFLSHLPSDEFQVTCICPYESPFTTLLREYGCDVYITPISDDPVWRSIQFTAEIARVHKTDVFHAHMPKAHTLAALAGNILHKPVVSSVHGMHYSSYEFSVTRLCNSQLIVNCQEAYGQALSLGVPADRVSLIHNGVDVQLFDPGTGSGKLSNMIDVPEGTTLVGFAGRLAYEKGPDLFLRIAQYVHYTLPGVHFVMVGEGDMKQELIQMCMQYGLEKYVHFIGWQTDMADVYRSLDILVYASRSDGTSLVLLEAMACSCPAVAMDVGGVREIVENGNTGILAPPLDWEMAAIKVMEVLASPYQLKQMATASRACVVKKFDLKIKTQHTANLLRQTAFQAINGHTVLHNGNMVNNNVSSALPETSILDTAASSSR